MFLILSTGIDFVFFEHKILFISKFKVETNFGKCSYGQVCLRLLSQEDHEFQASLPGLQSYALSQKKGKE
jgi:hypothetical protein